MRKPIDEQQNDDLGALRDLVDAAREDTPTEVQWQTARRNLTLRLQAGKKENLIMSILRSSFSSRMRWAISAAAVVLVVAFVIGMNPFERSSAGVYAAVVEQLKKAKTMVYKMTTSGQAPMPTMTTEVSFKEPGHMRTSASIGSTTNYTIIDKVLKRAISVTPSQKKYMELNLSGVPSQQSPMSEIDIMRNLPERAQELPEQKVIDGHTLKGFQVTEGGMEKTMWVDASTNELVRMEGNLANSPGLQVVITDFKFDVDLDDSLFDMTPPAGYQKLNITIPSQEPTEDSLISFLRIWATEVQDGQFPDSLSIVDITNNMRELKKSGKSKYSDNDKNLTEEQQIQKTLQLTFGALFVMKMKPENVWHYAGKGVKLGEADKAIFWYRPTGLANYRVIYGDLSTKQITSEEEAQLQDSVLRSGQRTLDEMPQSKPSACQMNLSKIQGAKQEWALNTHADPAVQPSWKDLVGPEAYIHNMPQCPNGGTYSINPLNQYPTCSMLGQEHKLTGSPSDEGMHANPAGANPAQPGIPDAPGAPGAQPVP